MQIYNIYKKNGTGIDEQCLKNIDGNFVGVETGTIYKCSEHYSRPQLLAKIIAVDNENKTGMYHLYSDCWSDGEEYRENRVDWKKKYIGYIITVEQAHYADDLPIYICLELDEFFSGDELELL